MLYLKNDYSLGAHPAVLEALVRSNMDCADGYGVDEYCKEAAGLILRRIDCPTAEVHFLPGGTITNMTAIAAFLRPHEAVISPDTGHICCHETGAVEATGHKIIHVPTTDGKIYPDQIDDVMLFHEDEHYVKPRLLYISDSTETGAYYLKKELVALRECCDRHHLLLYVDGARMAMALTASGNDVAIEDFPKIADAFYIGGTKCGTLFGEALVVVNETLKSDLRFLIKQRGGLMAKGRLLGVQFQALLKDDLYFELGRHANLLAAQLAQGIKKAGYRFAVEPATNLIFPVFPDSLVDQLKSKVMFEGWRTYKDGTSAIRLVTSWGSTKQDIDEFLALITEPK